MVGKWCSHGESASRGSAFEILAGIGGAIQFYSPF